MQLIQPNSRPSSPEEKRDRFEIVSGNLELVELTKVLFDKMIKPLYGDQTTAIERIEKGEDRTTKILFQGGTEVGILVIKSKPNSEFVEDGADKAVEIKTLFVIDPENRPRAGTGTKLIKEAIEHAKSVGADNIAVNCISNKNRKFSFLSETWF